MSDSNQFYRTTAWYITHQYFNFYLIPYLILHFSYTHNFILQSFIFPVLYLNARGDNLLWICPWHFFIVKQDFNKHFTFRHIIPSSLLSTETGNNNFISIHKKKYFHVTSKQSIFLHCQSNWLGSKYYVLLDFKLCQVNRTKHDISNKLVRHNTESTGTKLLH